MNPCSTTGLAAKLVQCELLMARRLATNNQARASYSHVLDNNPRE